MLRLRLLLSFLLLSFHGGNKLSRSNFFLRFACLLMQSVVCVRAGESATFTFVNKCGETVWPGILSNAGSAQLQPTGFELAAGSSRALPAPAGWSGRFWARTGCSASSGTDAWSCATGDCGSGQVECRGAGAAPPATLAEFTLASSSSAGRDFYDVSLVDGYNLPVLVEAGRGCAAAGCAMDIGARCPAELRAGRACKSACDAFGKPEYCCSGAYASPATCRPTAYSQLFKTACPKSYSYAYDDPTSTFTCSGGADYTITFCPDSASSLKSSSSSSSSTSTPTSTSTSSSSTSTSTSRPAAGGVMLADDTWLASLATGDASPSRRSVSFLCYSLIAAATAYTQFFLL
ncbi:thaumatin-like protein 1b isoform X2 [Canna indica]|uniref:Thaumatin-like protein 1b isoform X2 n=1 Tax=Canna indica TaxID=4628 RepID=A0AAQ3KCF5_9LILI|nr:thaumatin-like protein 1b isoform X2 [Canna indica]